MSEHVGVHPRHADPCRLGQLPESAGGCVPVHPHAVDVAENRSGVAAFGGPVDRAVDSRRKRDQHGLVAFAVGFRPTGLEDPQAEETEHGDQGEVVDVRRQSRGVDQRFELQVAEPEGG
jgi:hypothetical protein